MEFLIENEQIIARITAMASVLVALFSYLWHRSKYRKETDEKKSDLRASLTKAETKVISLEGQKESLENRKQELEKIIGELKVDLNRIRTNPENDTNQELIQLEKIMYVKYLYITPKSHPPVYMKKFDRLDQEYPVWTESINYRFHRFNKKHEIVVKDVTDGVVDLAIIYPWQRIRGHKLHLNNPQEISQKLKNSDTYITASNYINGFVKDEEDYAIMAECKTKSARIIADFSSIKNFENLFQKEPDAYRFFDISKEKENPINNCITKLRKGVYSLHANNLDAEEIIKLDFHINWNYLD
ncbi:MAG: hypothetical protein AAGH81_10715 [Bacteroidota bacterium]